MPTTIFTANDGAHGRELWRTDGTASGTFMIVDLKPGAADGLVNASGGFGYPLYSAVGNVFFTYDDGVHGSELWATDGSAAGTRLVKDLRPGSAATTFGSIFTFGNKLFFSADVGDGKGAELYASDGTPDGTGLVADLNATRGSDPSGFTAYGGKVYFTADRPNNFNGSTGMSNGGTGAELFVTNGTAAGTQLVVDLAPGQGSATIGQMNAVGGKLIMSYRDNVSSINPNGDYHFAVSDGTQAGTTTFTPTSTSGGKLQLFGARAVLGDQLYFDALNASTNTNQLWVTDGTLGGTRLVDAAHPIDSSGGAAVLGDKLIYRSYDASVGSELFIADGSGARLLKDIYPGQSTTNATVPLSSDPSFLGTIGGRLYFVARDGAYGRELWSTDGTEAGTQLVKDVGPFSGIPQTAALIGGTIVFDGNDGLTGEELWTSDGTSAGTRLVTDINAQLDRTVGTNGPTYFGDSVRRPVSGGLLFEAYTQDRGFEPWISDGTLAGTRQLPTNFDSGFGDSYITSFRSYGAGVAFVRNNALWVADDDVFTNAHRVSPTTIGASTSINAIGPSVGTNLFFLGYNAATSSGDSAFVYVSDGTADGTRLLRTSTGQALTGALDALDDRIIIRPTFGLFASDGTNAGTVQIGVAGDTYAFGGRIGANFFFIERNPTSGASSVVATDGTAAGTQTVAALPFTTTITSSFAVGSTRVLLADGQLYRTDGTAAGTYQIQTGSSGTFTSIGISTAGEIGTTYFVARSGPSFTNSLWVTDGTNGGTRLLNSNLGDTTDLKYLNGQLYYTLRNPTGDLGGLYAANADGTGQHLISDAAGFGAITIAAGKVFVTGFDRANGAEIWTSDGTAAGTLRLTDTYTNPSSSPASFTRLISTGEFAVAAPDVALAHDTGLSATDVITSDAALTITPAVSGGKLAYVVDGVAVASYNAASLGQGAHSVTITQTDEAGQVSAPGTITFTLDTVAPVNVIDSPPGSAVVGVPQVIAGHGAAADAGGRVEITEGGAVLGTTTVGSGGQWATTVQLAEGFHHLTAVLTDLAGNMGSATTDITAVAPANPPGTLPPTNPPSASHAPVAASDGLSVAAHAIATGNVLGNDGDPDGDALHVASVRFAGGHDYAVAASGTTTLVGELGTLQIAADGHYSYVGTVAGTEAFVDRFTVTVADSHGATASSALVASVTAAAIAPDATFAFAFASASLSYVGGEAILIGSDGVAHDVTGIGTLRFTDGTIVGTDGQPLVDDLFYFATNKDVWAAHIDAETHYAQSGRQEGRNPNAFFSARDYLAANPDVAAAGADPFGHYVAFGASEGRDPGLAFSATWYRALHPDVAAAGVDPLAHYLAFGQAEGRVVLPGGSQHGVQGGFDAPFYLARNPDVAAAGGDPLQHYLSVGWHEGRDPDAFFSTTGYLAANPDVAAAGADPLLHYQAYGWREGRDPSDGFSTNGYLAANPDVAAAHVDPLQHYLQFGSQEGRHGWEL